MPDGFIPNEGLAGELTRRVNPSAMGGRVSRVILWINDHTPTGATVLADLTPASFEGYTFFTLTDADWQAPTVAAGCARSVWGAAALQWTVGDPRGQTVYGWALVDVGAGVLRFVQRFDPLDIRPLVFGDVLTLSVEQTETSAVC